MGDWNSLHIEVQDLILARLPLTHLFQIRLVCKDFRDVITRKTFHQARACVCLTECPLSPLLFYVENGAWHLRGFDFKNQIWRKLPSFKDPIPAPDPEVLFRLNKGFRVAVHKGLICVNVGKVSAFEGGKLYICNLLTGETFRLPAFKFSRHPVVLSVHVKLANRGNTISSSYQVIAAGSAASGTESLSRKTEVFDSDSVSGDWEVAGDVPGSHFYLNDYQTGVYCESQNLLLCVGIMVDGRKGILAFDAVRREWLEDWICPLFTLHVLADTGLPIIFGTVQLVVCSEKIYVFSEHESGGKDMHCIDRLDLDIGPERQTVCTWTRLVEQPNPAVSEYTCVPVGENKLCIFDTEENSGVIYDMLKITFFPEAAGQPFPSPVMENGIVFRSLNPVGYAFEPSFGVSPSPRTNIQGGHEGDLNEGGYEGLPRPRSAPAVVTMAAPVMNEQGVVPGAASNSSPGTTPCCKCM